MNLAEQIKELEAVSESYIADVQARLFAVIREQQRLLVIAQSALKHAAPFCSGEPEEFCYEALDELHAAGIGSDGEG